MMPERRFDDLEFVVRWEVATGDRLPAPLIFTTDIIDGDEYEATKRRVRDRLASEPDETIDGPLAALARPDLTVQVTGVDPRAPENPATAIRIYAASCGDRAFVVRQLPGRTVWHAAGFVVTACDPATVADAVVGVLPRMVAGRRPHTELPSQRRENAGDDLDYSYGRSRFRDDDEDSVAQRAEAFWRLPTSAAGRIDIVQGESAFGPRGRTRRRLRWRDILDDGRYAIVGDNRAIAKGVDAKGLVHLINEEIEEVQLVIDDENRAVGRRV
ncbi:ESX secretion-associated protein EspG [Nocardia sp. NPDC049220]|uniref:ESX secretion-associated protein EspG n=1 Tax=Nocardia sp. NPDC049220 TaxID=3155273 RepID=UPI0033D56A93